MTEPKTLKARADIEGGEWTLPKGTFLEGTKTEDGTWKVWKKGDYHSFICGVPEQLIYVFP